MNNDEAMSNIYKKIEREKALINAANAMRQQTNNDDVRSRLDSQMREGRRNLQFFEEKLRDLQVKRLGKGVDDMSLSSSSTAAPSLRHRSTDTPVATEGPPAPPPKDGRGGYGQGTDRASYGAGDYSQIGGHGDMMPPRHPYAPPGPNQNMPKQRPNFTKLGMLTHSRLV
jgi:hypothetical protein